MTEVTLAKPLRRSIAAGHPWLYDRALVDGAGRWHSFRHITMPAILPVTTTIVLIRLIEGFKIIDMPNILLGGGPGTATQSMKIGRAHV